MSATVNPLEGISWEQARTGLRLLAKEAGEWAGLPMPVEGIELDIDERYPFAKVFSKEKEPEEGDSEDCWQVVNTWLSMRMGGYVSICRKGNKFKTSFGRVNHASMEVGTILASRMWDVESEIRAMETLGRHVSSNQLNTYWMTGGFTETSRKSKLTYVFRRLRPTLVISSYGDQPRFIAALCGHPIGYAKETWAGVLVPTDDVMASLLLMRSDEKFFWRTSRQHPVWAPEAGV